MKLIFLSLGLVNSGCSAVGIPLQHIFVSNNNVTTASLIALSPAKKNLPVFATQTIGFSGGVAPYTCHVLAGGAGGAVTTAGSACTYTASASLGRDTVQVTDSLGEIQDAVFGVLSTTWHLAGPPNFAQGSGLASAYSASGNLVVAYSDSNQSAKITVKIWNGFMWSSIGPDGITPGGVGSIAVTLDSLGNPYILYSDATNTNKLSVQHWDGSNWTLVGSAAFSPSYAITSTIALDSSNHPYVAYQDSTNSSKLTVQQWNGSSWTVVGSAGVSTAVASALTLRVDPSDTPYVAFNDSTDGVRVVEWNSSNWVTVGNASVISTQSSYVSMVLDSSNYPVVAYQDNSQSNRVTVSTFDGSNWSTLGNTAFTPPQAQNFTLYMDSSSQFYLAFSDITASGRATMMKDVSGTWTNYGDSGISELPMYSPPGLGINSAGNLQLISNFVLYEYSLDTSASGANVLGWGQTSPQVGVSVSANWTAAYDAFLRDQKVQYYSDEFCGSLSGSASTLGSPFTGTFTGTGSVGSFLSYRVASVNDSGVETWSRCSSEMGFRSIWSYVGAKNPFPSFPSTGIAMAVDSAGNPFVLIVDQNQQNRLSLYHWSGSGWTLVGSAGFSPTSAIAASSSPTSIRIVLDSSDLPYVEYVNLVSGNMNLVVMHFDGSAWNYVGSPNFSPSPALYADLSLTLDSSGLPYVSVTTAAGVNALFFNGSTWQYVGGSAQNFNGSRGVLTLDTSNNIYLAYANTSSRAQVKKWNGSSWSTLGASNLSSGQPLAFKLVLDLSGNLYMMYYDYGIFGYGVQKWDGSSWSNLTAGLPSGSFGGAGLAIDSSNLVHVLESTSTGEAEYEFNGSSWLQEGSSYLDSYGSYSQLVASSTGTLYGTFTNSTHGTSIRRFDQ